MEYGHTRNPNPESEKEPFPPKIIWVRPWVELLSKKPADNLRNENRNKDFEYIHWDSPRSKMAKKLAVRLSASAARSRATGCHKFDPPYT